MHKQSSSWIIAISVRVYQWLLCTGPREFRREYGLPMVQLFRQCCRDAYQQRGIHGVISLWLPTFSDLVTGMLAERFAVLKEPDEQHGQYFPEESVLFERIKHMLRTQIRSMLIIFCAYMIFGLPWLFFQGLIDPLSEWTPIVTLHPEIGVVFKIVQIAGEIAFLLLLIGGIPIVFTAVKRSLKTGQRNVLILFSVAGVMLLIFLVASLLLVIGWWPVSIDRNGGIYVSLSLVTLLVTAVALVQAMMRSEPSERVLRFALFPATGVIVAMGLALVANIVEVWLLSREAPQLFENQDVFLWTPLMAITTCVAVFALWRGIRARTPARIA